MKKLLLLLCIGMLIISNVGCSTNEPEVSPEGNQESNQESNQEVSPEGNQGANQGRNSEFSPEDSKLVFHLTPVNKEVSKERLK